MDDQKDETKLQNFQGEHTEEYKMRHGSSDHGS